MATHSPLPWLGEPQPQEAGPQEPGCPQNGVQLAGRVDVAQGGGPLHLRSGRSSDPDVCPVSLEKPGGLADGPGSCKVAPGERSLVDEGAGPLVAEGGVASV